MLTTAKDNSKRQQQQQQQQQQRQQQQPPKGIKILLKLVFACKEDFIWEKGVTNEMHCSMGYLCATCENDLPVLFFKSRLFDSYNCFAVIKT